MLHAHTSLCSKERGWFLQPWVGSEGQNHRDYGDWVVLKAKIQLSGQVKRSV